jgi:ribosome maturation factor RimP
MKKMSIVVDSIEFVKENKYHFLKIVLDKVNGIDMDTIVEASKIINPIVDKLDLIDQEYILDISSKERGI